MKFALLALALLPLSAAAMTAGDAQLVRMMDGHAVNCTETYEGGKTGYVPEVKSLSVDEDGRVQLSLNVSFQLCIRAGDVVHWGPRSPLDPIYGQDSDGHEVRTEFRDPELVLGNSTYTSQQVFPLTNDPAEKVDYQFLPSEFLSKQELSELDAGKPVRVHLYLLYRAIGTAFTTRGEEPLGYQFGATYTLLFTLQK